MIMLCYNLYYTYHNKKILGVTFTVIDMKFPFSIFRIFELVYLPI